VSGHLRQFRCFDHHHDQVSFPSAISRQSDDLFAQQQTEEAQRGVGVRRFCDVTPVELSSMCAGVSDLLSDDLPHCFSALFVQLSLFGSRASRDSFIMRSRRPNPYPHLHSSSTASNFSPPWRC